MTFRPAHDLLPLSRAVVGDQALAARFLRFGYALPARKYDEEGHDLEDRLDDSAYQRNEAYDPADDSEDHGREEFRHAAARPFGKRHGVLQVRVGDQEQDPCDEVQDTADEAEQRNAGNDGAYDREDGGRADRTDARGIGRVHLSLEDVEGLDEEPVSVDKGHGGEDFKRIPEAEASAREITLGQGRESRSGIADRSDEAEDRGSDGCERIDLDSLVQIGGRLFPRVVQIVLHGSDDIGFFESVILSAVFDLEVEAEDERQHAE